MEGGDEKESKQKRRSSWNPWKRSRDSQKKNPKKRSTSSRKRKNMQILVFDHSSNIPTNPTIDDDGSLILTGGIEGKQYLVDKDDFIAMNEVMNKWKPLTYRHITSEKRFITALHAIKEFVQVDNDGGTYKIVNVDLSQLLEIRKNRADRDQKKNILVIPPSIGKLNCLQVLNLQETDIFKILPHILSGCKYLKVLNLSITKNLVQLPKEIGFLSQWEELDLNHSGIRCIPHFSIWSQLKSLKVLDLGNTYNLQKMEYNLEAMELEAMENHEEEKMPVSLRKLNLKHSALLEGRKDWHIVKFFLSSNTLDDLDLGGAKDMNSLEDVVVHTNKLKRLNLSSTDISMLPPTTCAEYEKLVHLKVLSLTSTPVLRKYPQQLKNAARCKAAEGPPLQSLVRASRSCLGCIGLRTYQTDGHPSHRKLRRALARNRARFRIRSLWNHKHSTEGGHHHFRFPRAVWPILLSTRTVFRPYEECNDSSCDCQRPLEECDAIFELLVAFANDIFERGAHQSRRVPSPVNNNDQEIDSSRWVLV